MKRTFLTLASLASAADWPTWRGPKRDDISTGKNLLTEWPVGGSGAEEVGAWQPAGCRWRSEDLSISSP